MDYGAVTEIAPSLVYVHFRNGVVNNWVKQLNE